MDKDLRAGGARYTVFKLLAIALGFLMAFAVAEVAVRIFSPMEVSPIRFVSDPELGDINTPNQHGRRIRPGYFDYSFSHNSLGFRGSKEYSYAKQEDYRLLLLGNSFTYGFGVNDDQTFVHLTEKHLLERGLSVEAINAGVPAKGTDYDLKFFQVLGYKFRPDLTILCFVANDFINNGRQEYYGVSAGGEIFPKTLKRQRGMLKTILLHLPGYNWMISWSQAANLIKEAGVKWYLKHTDPIALKEGAMVIFYPNYRGGFARPENTGLTEIYLKNLLKSVKNAGGSLMVFYLPIPIEVEAYRQNRAVSHDEATLAEIVKNEGEPLLSLTPALAASGDPMDRLYFPKDGHWTPLGHARAAQYMSEQIEVRLRTSLATGLGPLN